MVVLERQELRPGEEEHRGGKFREEESKRERRLCFQKYLPVVSKHYSTFQYHRMASGEESWGKKANKSNTVAYCFTLTIKIYPFVNNCTTKLMNNI